jgi:hypothetical protein
MPTDVWIAHRRLTPRERNASHWGDADDGPGDQAGERPRAWPVDGTDGLDGEQPAEGEADEGGEPAGEGHGDHSRGSLTTGDILDAAERVAGEGFAALTIRAVAADLQASPMALYRYFATKDDLVDALLTGCLATSSPRPPPTTGSRIYEASLASTGACYCRTRGPSRLCSLTPHPD